MNTDLTVDAEALRDAAAAVTGLAGRVSGAAGSVPSAVPSPRWATTGAAASAADAARHLLSVLGHDLSESADRIRAAATAYEEVDARAAARLRTIR